jgi:flagellar basal body-associated protein FliL
MGEFLKITFIIAASGFFVWLMLYFAWLAIKPEKKPETKNNPSVKPSK